MMMNIKTTQEIRIFSKIGIMKAKFESQVKKIDDVEWIPVNDLIKYLKGKGITKYHLIGKLLNTRKQSKGS